VQGPYWLVLLAHEDIEEDRPWLTALEHRCEVRPPPPPPSHYPALAGAPLVEGHVPPPQHQTTCLVLPSHQWHHWEAPSRHMVCLLPPTNVTGCIFLCGAVQPPALVLRFCERASMLPAPCVHCISCSVPTDMWLVAS
jgi:hypothetical protein